MCRVTPCLAYRHPPDAALRCAPPGRGIGTRQTSATCARRPSSSPDDSSPAATRARRDRRTRWVEVQELAPAGVTLFLDLTQNGELEPYASLVEPPARYLNLPIRDFSIPTRDGLVATLDEIDAELDAGGLVYVHCWAGCGRTGVVVGSWLVRHGVDPNVALDADRRGAWARLPADARAAHLRARLGGGAVACP